MAEEKKVQTQEAVKSKELQKETIEKYGGFPLLETTVEGLQNLNPDRKARRNIFLNEDGKKEERQQLENRLELWLQALESSADQSEIVESCNEKATKIDEVLAQNVGKALEASKELEQAYRSVALFYKNAEADKIKNVNFINADTDQIADLDTALVQNAINEELSEE